MKRRRSANWHNLKDLARDSEQRQTEEKRFVRIPASQPIPDENANTRWRKQLRVVISTAVYGLAAQTALGT